MTALLKKIFKAFVLKMLLTTGINLCCIRDKRHSEMNLQDFYRRKIMVLKSFEKKIFLISNLFMSCYS